MLNTQKKHFHFKSGIIDLFFLAGATLLLILIILSGASKNPSFPINRFYWVEGDTSSIPNAYDVSRWTYWGVCEKIGSRTKNCNDAGPAYPISPVDNFNTKTNVPQYFIDNEDTFYYLSRVGWSTLLIALVFSAISLIFAVLSVCSFHLQKVTAVFSFIGSLMNFAAAALYTATCVLVKKHLNKGKIGPTLMGLVWASAVCNLIVMATTFGSCTREAYRRARQRHDEKNAGVYPPHTQAQGPQVIQDGSMFTSEPKKSTSSGPGDQGAINYNNPYEVGQEETQPQESFFSSKRDKINFLKINRNKKLEEDSDA